MIYFYNLSVKRFAVAAAVVVAAALVCLWCVVTKIAFNIFLGFQILMRFPTATAAAAGNSSFRLALLCLALRFVLHSIYGCRVAFAINLVPCLVVCRCIILPVHVHNYAHRFSVA